MKYKQKEKIPEVSDYKENYVTGWVKIYRSIKKHWLWDEPEKFQWWIDILLETNHKPQKVNIKNELFEVKRGQTIKSQKTWAKRWKTSRGKVRNFLKILENDSMITLKTTNKTTILTVCNYETYQNQQPTDEQRTNNGRTTDEQRTNTNKNDNNIKNEKNEKILSYFLNLQTNKKEIVNNWLKYRVELKKPIIVESTLKALSKKFNDNSFDKCKWVINNSIENNYQGLFWNNYKEPNNTERIAL